jgi:hypothetical protein
MISDPVTALPVDALQDLLGAPTPIDYPAASRARPYHQWRMESMTLSSEPTAISRPPDTSSMVHGGERERVTCSMSARPLCGIESPFGEHSDDGSKVYGSYPEELPELKE